MNIFADSQRQPTNKQTLSPRTVPTAPFSPASRSWAHVSFLRYNCCRAWYQVS